MRLTTDILTEKYGSFNLQIIEQKFPYRYVHIYSHDILQVAAFSDYSDVNLFIIDDAKAAILQEKAIGVYLRETYNGIKKICLEEGLIQINLDLKETFKQTSQFNKYRLFDLKIVVEGKEHSISKVTEIYNQTFPLNEACPSNISFTLKHLNLYSYIKNHNIELHTGI